MASRRGMILFVQKSTPNYSNVSQRRGSVANDAFLNSINNSQSFCTSAPDSFQGGSSGKKYADYTLFKGKAALSVSPVLPKFRQTGSGISSLHKKGSVMLTLWPAIGTRKYDWEKKQRFALSPTEVGALVSLGPSESCEFFHDPSMKSSLEGQIKKNLSIAPMADQTGYFLNLNVINNVDKTNERLGVPVSKAEFSVLRTALSYVLPHIMGWDQLVTLETGTGSGTNYVPKIQVDRANPDYEWSR